MTNVIPARFLFRFNVPVPYVEALPTTAKDRLVDLPATAMLPTFDELDGLQPFATIQLGWNEEGLGCVVTVTGKQQPLHAPVATPLMADGLQLWIDTRNTQNLHRATRFCHHFAFLPTSTAPGRKGAPYATQFLLARSRDETELADPKLLRVKSVIHEQGYRLEAWIPAAALTGFDPAQNPRLGFYYLVNDQELGRQAFSVASDFPFDNDPSLWQSIELVR